MGVSLLALVISLGGAGFAATGGTFILGKGNSATSRTTLTANINDETLHVTNANNFAQATAAGFYVAPGHPPFKTNSTFKVAHLNADFLDSLDSNEFGRVFALHHQNLTKTLAAGDNYSLMTTGFTAAATGRCLVTAETQIDGVSTTATGPFYRAAVAKNGGAPTNDTLYGHYFNGIHPLVHSSDFTRVATFDVTQGDVVQFGAFFGSVPAGYVGANAFTDLSFFCTTIGSIAGPAFATTLSGAPVKDVAAAAQEVRGRNQN
jgi:hypothetical protein